ncbi:MAG: small multi-drug export protein [Clostridia bacterium]|nr:small multi-drug export protein [Clostridia bacterium]
MALFALTACSNTTNTAEEAGQIEVLTNEKPSLSRRIWNFFVEKVGARISVFICSMIPFIELRGAIPLGAGMGLNPFLCYLVAVLGNMLPVPFILLFIRAILEWMKKTKLFGKFALWLESKGEKNKDRITKYGFWGLTLFVMIPLPGTGAWTGSLVAAMLHMPFWRAMLSTLIGVMSAGVIMTFISYGVATIFG